MKKLVSILFVLVMSMALSCTAFGAEEKERLYDYADLLTDAQEEALVNKLNAVSNEFKVDIIIATVDTVGAFSADVYVEMFYDDNGLGFGANRDGVLLLVAMNEREYRILSNGPIGAAAISMKDIEDIGDEITPDLSAGDYAGAFHTFAEACEYQINGEINGFPFRLGRTLLISLGVGFLLALIVTGIMSSQLKSVKRQLTAKEYIKKDSMQITSAKELYLYCVVHREEIQHETSKSSGFSSSSGSSGSRNVGGGKF